MGISRLSIEHTRQSSFHAYGFAVLVSNNEDLNNLNLSAACPRCRSAGSARGLGGRGRACGSCEVRLPLRLPVAEVHGALRGRPEWSKAMKSAASSGTRCSVAERPVAQPLPGCASQTSATKRALRRRRGRAGALPRRDFDHAGRLQPVKQRPQPLHLNGQGQGNRRLGRWLARAPEAVAGRPEGRPLPWEC